ncbi:MAG: 3-hydroxyacyl-ACP dehydratase FabZ [Caldimicrobium sp.]|nr:3-hydroxyacyl-ACP dehydratase FabZ [Caldimicrobium sp.]MCX7613469.1 3-hydroxyacyl-ACP dehydratase FabZ [Caldimicrobium sp.]MDW8182959.1 3-hydroxyacyl-ACP dehydratase FabZ [Caldimicrobium sp.]
MEEKKELSIRGILQTIPHRYPFLMVDRVLEIDRERAYIKALKNVSINEPYFQGHFPDYPIMPGVLILEAMAQTGAIYLKVVFPECADKLFVLAGMENVRFKNPVFPGDTLIIEAEGFKRKGHIIRTNVVAKVDDKVVAQAEIIAAMVEVKNG